MSWWSQGASWSGFEVEVGDVAGVDHPGVCGTVVGEAHVGNGQDGVALVGIALVVGEDGREGSEVSRACRVLDQGLAGAGWPDTLDVEAHSNVPFRGVEVLNG